MILFDFLTSLLRILGSRLLLETNLAPDYAKFCRSRGLIKGSFPINAGAASVGFPEVR